MTLDSCIKGIMGSFFHRRIGGTRLLETVCLFCSARLAASPFAFALAIVERLHHCRHSGD